MNRRTPSRSSCRRARFCTCVRLSRRTITPVSSENEFSHSGSPSRISGTSWWQIRSVRDESAGPAGA